MHQTHEARALFQIYPVKNPSNVVSCEAFVCTSALLRKISADWGRDRDCQNTTPLLSSPPPKKKPAGWGNKPIRTGRLWGIGTQPDNLPVRFGSAVAQSPLSPLSFRDSYLLVRRRTGQRERVRERESCNTCLHLQGLLTWLMKQLTQWLTPVHWVTKKSPGRPEMVRYWFLLFPQRNPPPPTFLPVPDPTTMKKKPEHKAVFLMNHSSTYSLGLLCT